jgi:anti-sigma factor RsiW
MMNCQGFQDHLFEYLDGSLSAPAQSAANAHVEQCAVCRQTVQAHQALAARFRRETDSLALHPEVTRRIEEALVETADHASQGRDAARRRDQFSVAQTSESAVSRVSKPAGLHEEPTWKSATQQVWKPALHNIVRLAWPAAIAAILLVAAGLAFRRPVQSSEAAQPPAPASISVRFSSCDPTYTFRREKNRVIDALTCTPRVVEENLSLSLNQKHIPPTQERKTPL